MLRGEKMSALKHCALLLVGVLVACGSTHYRNIKYPSYGQPEFDRDYYECSRENTSQQGILVPGVGGPVGTYGAYVDPRMRDQCMRVRGWYEVSS